MSRLEKAKERARALEVKDAKGAVDAWIEVLKEQDASGEPNPDLAIYNKVGDLWLKLKDPAQAADFYDRAVDKYAEQGLHNNAIAMCNKVLRNAPGRQNTYLKLAKLYAAKGFNAEAKQNFVEYAERVHKTGNIQLAFAALKEFTDISSDGEQLRHMLEEQLAAYGVNENPRRTTQSQKVVEPPKPTNKRKTSSLVFLDLDAPTAPKGETATAPAPAAPKPAAPAPKPQAPPPPKAPAPAATAPPKVAAPKVAAPPKPQPKPAPPPPEPEPEPEPMSVLDEAPVAEPDTSLQIESTSLVDDEISTGSGSLLEGLESTSADFGSVRESATNIESVREEIVADDVQPMAELEPTAEEEPVVELPPAVPPRGTKGRQAVVELSLDDEPQIETEPDVVAPVDDEPLMLDETVGQETRDFIMTEDDTSVGGRPSVHIDVGLDSGMLMEDQAPAIDFSDIEEAPVVSIEDLEGRVADNPDDPEAHQALGEALVEAGDRERGIEELDHATAGFEGTGNAQQAEDLVDEILRLDPNSIRHRQKVVEFAFKSGEKDRLITAYLELGDTLLRNDLPEKARSVYVRVAEHDPKNARAQSALAMLAPAVPAAPEGKVKAKDAKMKVRDEAAEGAEFVDLGSMILDDNQDEARDSRMKVQDEEPTGDEQQDFQEMLARFKQGIDENIEETDFQSHYDLGVAFKEMGLLDEGIAEFQKALRAHDGKLRTSEALGVCFFEKGAFGVAESILRRGLELPAAGEEERLGILYWLGRSCEEQGRAAEAKDLYGKVFAVNIRFLDVGERVKALAKAR
ncbi:MAG TPA: tetratricopeptide repeat protein [Gemmatimonadales bacterium]|jgi:tetratricopeptide (TPR) repeat protein|nr:tetratricopeptide repeat protein [Gemmatimonadales bacterium]